MQKLPSIRVPQVGGPATGGCCSPFLKHMTMSKRASIAIYAIWPWILKERNEHSKQILSQNINRNIFLNVDEGASLNPNLKLVLEIGKLTWNVKEKLENPASGHPVIPHLTSYLLLKPK